MALDSYRQMGWLLALPRLLLGLVWRALLAIVTAFVFARVDEYVERRYGGTRVGRLYLSRRRAGTKGS